jgi:NOL1/NOP2/fmu family ribosome biogenesis protein
MNGEGHYIALLEKEGTDRAEVNSKGKSNLDKKQEEELKKFIEENLKISYMEFLKQGTFQLFGESLYLVPEELAGYNLKGLKIVRNGLHFGEFKKNRFEPSHHLALALREDEVKSLCNLSIDGQEITRYLAGESLNVDEKLEGWTLVSVDGYSLGWGKSKNGTLKNHYPKGLRVAVSR